MKSFASARFWQLFNDLPQPLQELARKNFALWQNNPQHPSLHFKPVGKYWSARVGIGCRALAIRDDDDFIWFWIGLHDDYERLISGS